MIVGQVSFLLGGNTDTSSLAPLAVLPTNLTWPLGSCSSVKVFIPGTRSRDGGARLGNSPSGSLANNGAFTITLVHDATSTAANRFYCQNSANFALLPNMTVLLRYDGNASRWRVK